MSFIHQSRATIVMQVLTINARVLVPYDKIIDSFWGVICFAKPTRDYLASVISRTRKILPAGRIEHVHGKGYIWWPTELEFARNKGKHDG